MSLLRAALKNKYAWPVVMVWLYWATRLWNLTGLPVFLDEAIYMRRAWLVHGGNWLAEIMDGAVLIPRLLAPVLPWAGPTLEGMLFTARWFTVAVDLFALLLIYVLVRDLFSSRAALLASLIYLFTPFVFVYDRMALADGPLLTLYVLAFWLALRVLRKLRPWREALLLGLVIGLASLTKASGILIMLAPMLVLFAGGDGRAALRLWPWWTAAFVVAAAIYAPFFLAGAGQYQLATRSALSAGGLDLLQLAAANGVQLLEWLAGYWPGLLALCFVLALAGSLSLQRGGLIWSAAALAPVLFFVVLARSWYPRYILLSMGPLIILAGWFCDWAGCRLDRIASRWSAPLLAALLVVVLAPSLQFDYAIGAAPADAPWPAVERWQYIENWPSGYGVQEAITLLRQAEVESVGGINLVRMNMNGPALEIVDMFLQTNARVSRSTMNLRQNDAMTKLTALSQERPTYIILDPPHEAFDFGRKYPQARLLGKFDKPGGQSSILVFEW